MNNNKYLDVRMRSFINDHHVLGLATVADNKPYCATMFYAFLEEHNAFVINSAEDTQHGTNMLKNNEVSGTIALETKIIGKIQGIQFCGQICRIEEFEHEVTARAAYFRRFPYASFSQPQLWVIKLDFVKMTDNRLGFGKKLIWRKD